MLRLFYAPGACSLASHIALEEAGAPFEAVRIDFARDEQRGADYLKVNPKGRVPALEADGWVLTENPAILHYIACAFPAAGLWPAGLREQARALEWMAWCASSVHVAFAHYRRAERYATAPAALDDVRAKGLETARALWRAVDERLGAGAPAGPWALGEAYCVVDPYLMAFWQWGPRLGLAMAADCPHWTRHALAMAGRPAVRRAFAREGLPLPA